MKPFILIILFGWLPLSLVAQYKAKQNLNTDWEFQFQGQSNWEQIHLPHTWNATDAVDDKSGYKRDVGIYQKTISIDKQENENYFLFFEGANLEKRFIESPQEIKKQSQKNQFPTSQELPPPSL